QEMFTRTYADVFTGDDRWRELDTPECELFAWEPESTYVLLPPYFEGMSPEPGSVDDVSGARCLVMLGDSVTTDHISPAGAIKPDSPAGMYLTDHGVERKNFNSYGSRRGNHEVMVRGTFANVRLRNLLVPGSEGTWTVHLPSGEEMSIFEASERYLAEATRLIVLAGKEYGTGSSRDWAAKGPKLLGVRAAIAESYERIHRSNLLMMGIVPLQYSDGENAESIGLTGRETFSISGIDNAEATEVTVRADDTEFTARVRLDTPREREYLRHGGILPFVLRRLLAAARRVWSPRSAARAPESPASAPFRPGVDNPAHGDALAPADRRGDRRHLRALARRGSATHPRDRRRADRRALRRPGRDRPVRAGTRTLPDHRHRRGDPRAHRRAPAWQGHTWRPDRRRAAAAAPRSDGGSEVGRLSAEPPADADVRRRPDPP